MAIAALDQGTTSTRALRLEDDGRAHVVHVATHRQMYPAPGWVEHDPEELMTALVACAEAAGDVDAIGLDNQGESCLAWNRATGEAISPVIVWQDSRTEPVIARLKAEGAEPMVLERAGLPLDAYFSATKLAWIVQNIPAAKALLDRGDLCLGTTDAFFLQRLTGRAVTDITTASRTALMNIRTGAWDEALCDLFGVPMEALPPIVPTTGDFGAVSLGGRAIPMVAAIVDQQAALYGHGCRTAGDTKITVGTGAFVLMVTGATVETAPDQGLLPTVAWQKAGEAPVYALDGGVYAAAAAVNWARSLGLFSSFDEINQFAAPPALSRGIAFVPALSGLACPHWRRDARGVFLGLSLETTRQDMMQALLEGIAFRCAEVVGAMSARIASKGPVSVDGGLANNPYFCQVLADAMGRAVDIPEGGELTALGTAALAAEAMGKAPQLRLARRHVAPGSDLTALRPRFAAAVDASIAWGAGDQATMGRTDVV